MFKAILKIVPKLEPKDLAAMQKALQTRFTKIAKSFGKGISKAIGAGGLIGLAVGLIDKLLNPLKETQEAIDRSLKASDDLVTNAKQFGTTAGRLAKLQAFAQSSGLDADNLSILITKFQTAVAEAQADPTKNTSVRNFVGEEDIAAAFFEFIQSLQKLDKNEQIRVQQEVFGEKQILKMADFLQSDFQELNKSFARFDAEKLSQALNKTGSLNDLQDTLTAIRGLDDIQAKASVINSGMITARDQSERILLSRENQQIANFRNLQTISDTSQKAFVLIDKGVAEVGKFITFATPAVTKLIDSMERMSKSKIFRGIFGGKDD